MQFGVVSVLNSAVASMLIAVVLSDVFLICFLRFSVFISFNNCSTWHFGKLAHGLLGTTLREPKVPSGIVPPYPKCIRIVCPYPCSSFSVVQCLPWAKVTPRVASPPWNLEFW